MKADEREDPRPMLRDMLAAHYVTGAATRGRISTPAEALVAARNAYIVADAMLKARDE